MLGPCTTLQMVSSIEHAGETLFVRNTTVVLKPDVYTTLSTTSDGYLNNLDPASLQDRMFIIYGLNMSHAMYNIYYTVACFVYTTVSEQCLRAFVNGLIESNACACNSATTSESKTLHRHKQIHGSTTLFTQHDFDLIPFANNFLFGFFTLLRYRNKTHVFRDLS